MKLDSEHLEILAVIVEKGGLSEGAEALGKSQPSVSRTMALLEDRLKMPLFEPGRRPLRPTELGAALARIGARIHALNKDATQLVDRYMRGQAGRICIGGAPLFMDGVVSTLMADFQSRNHHVEIQQSYGYFDELSAALRHGSIDMAVLPMNAAQVPADFVFTPLLMGRNVIACRAGHPLARARAITMADIDPYPWITPPRNSPLFRDLERTLKSIGKEDYRVIFSGGTLAATLSVLTGSDALTVLPYSLVFLSRRNLAITALPVKIEHPDRHLGIMRMADRQPVPAEKHLTDWLGAELTRLQARMDHEQQVTRRRG